MKLYRFGIHDKQLHFSENKRNETIYQKKKCAFDRANFEMNTCLIFELNFKMKILNNFDV